MLDWLKHNVWWISACSAVFLVGGAIALSVFVTRVPADYFLRPASRGASMRGRHPGIRLAWKVAKNLMGVLLLVAGIVLSLPLVPGPGLLLILIGITLTDFP